MQKKKKKKFREKVGHPFRMDHCSKITKTLAKWPNKDGSQSSASQVSPYIVRDDDELETIPKTQNLCHRPMANKKAKYKNEKQERGMKVAK